jgi:predicted nucleic acid-binding protein
MRLIFLDSGPLGMVANPRGKPKAVRCQLWALGLLAAGVRVFIPEICDYENRRELIRRGATTGLGRLDKLKTALEYVPITTDAMLLAAQLWATVRQAGMPTAADDALDGDCILAAQALTAAGPGDTVIVATENVGHLSRFPGIDAQHWTQIAP